MLTTRSDGQEFFAPIDVRKVVSEKPESRAIFRFSNGSEEFKTYYRQFLEIGCEKFLKKGNEFTVLLSGPLQYESILCEVIQKRIIEQRLQEIEKSEDAEFDPRLLEPTEKEKAIARAKSQQLESTMGADVVKFIANYRLKHPELKDLIIYRGRYDSSDTITSPAAIVNADGELQKQTKAKLKDKTLRTVAKHERPLFGFKHNVHKIASTNLSIVDAKHDSRPIELKDYLNGNFQKEVEEHKKLGYKVFILLPWKYEVHEENETYQDAVKRLDALFTTQPAVLEKLENLATQIGKKRLEDFYKKLTIKVLIKLYKNCQRIKQKQDSSVSLEIPVLENGENNVNAIILTLVNSDYCQLASQRKESTQKFLTTEFPVFIKRFIEAEKLHKNKDEKVSPSEVKAESVEYDGYPFTPHSFGEGVFNFGANVIFEKLFGDYSSWYKWVDTSTVIQEEPKKKKEKTLPRILKPFSSATERKSPAKLTFSSLAFSPIGVGQRDGQPAEKGRQTKPASLALKSPIFSPVPKHTRTPSACQQFHEEEDEVKLTLPKNLQRKAAWSPAGIASPKKNISPVSVQRDAYSPFKRKSPIKRSSSAATLGKLESDLLSPGLKQRISPLTAQAQASPKKHMSRVTRSPYLLDALPVVVELPKFSGEVKSSAQATVKVRATKLLPAPALGSFTTDVSPTVQVDAISLPSLRVLPGAHDHKKKKMTKAARSSSDAVPDKGDQQDSSEKKHLPSDGRSYVSNTVPGATRRPPKAHAFFNKRSVSAQISVSVDVDSSLSLKDPETQPKKSFP